MSEIIPWRGDTGAVTYRRERDVVDGWAGHWGQVIELVRYIADSDFVPEALRGNRPAVAAAILAGREVGLGPMTSLQHVHVVNGTPALSAHMQRALAQSAGCKFKYVERTDKRCTVLGRAPGDEDWTSVTWTLDDARARNLVGKKNWREMPRQMLTARATGELCRLIAADALSGMAYSVEELTDDATPSDEAKAIEAPRRTVRRQQAPLGDAAGRREETPPPGVPAEGPSPREEHQRPGGDQPPAGPPLPGEPGYDQLEAPARQETPPDPPGPAEKRDTREWAITEPQSKKLHAMLRDIGINDRELGLAFLSLAVGRPIDTSKELTRAETVGVIDFLTLAESSDELSEQIAEIVTDPNPIAALNRFAGLFAPASGDGTDD